MLPGRLGSGAVGDITWAHSLYIWQNDGNPKKANIINLKGGFSVASLSSNPTSLNKRHTQLYRLAPYLGVVLVDS